MPSLTQVGQVESDEECRSVLSQRMCDGFFHSVPIFKDVTTVKTDAQKELSDCDGLVGGFPCQDSLDLTWQLFLRATWNYFVGLACHRKVPAVTSNVVKVLLIWSDRPRLAACNLRAFAKLVEWKDYQTLEAAWWIISLISSMPTPRCTSIQS